MTEIDRRFVQNLKGRDYCTYPGCLDAATRAGLTSLTTRLLQIPTKENSFLAIVEATAVFAEDADGEGTRTFTDIADASPASVSSAMAPALVRMASTRAKGRVLRDALNIGEALLEEVGDADENAAQTQPRAAYRAPAPPADREAQSPRNPPESAGDEKAALLSIYGDAQKRARQLGVKFQILSASRASASDVAEATLALKAQISEQEERLARTP